MFNNNSYRPAYATAGQASSPQNARQHSGILFNSTSSETEDFNSFNSSQQARPARRPAPSKQPKKRSGEIDLKKLLIIAASVAAVVLLGIIIVLVATSSSGDLTIKNNAFASYELDGKYFVAMNGETVGAGFDNEIELTPAIDKSFAYVTEESPDGYNVYILDKQELTPAVSAAVEIKALAESAPGIIYKDGKTFYLYTEKSDEQITSKASAREFVIAPDASSVAYIIDDDNDITQTKLMAYIDGVPNAYASNMHPVAISNGGKCVYAYGNIADESGAIVKKLYAVLNETEKNPIATGFVSLNYMNIKGDEIIYSTGSLESGIQSYIYSAKKEDSFKIGTGNCYPVIYDPTVARLASLKDIVVENKLPFLNKDGKLTSATYYVDKKYDSSNISKYNGTLNPDGDVFFFIDDNKEFNYIDLDDKNKNINYITEGVNEFVVTAKGNVYYLDSENRLFFYDVSTGKPKRVPNANKVEYIVLNSYSNVLYYTIEDDTKAYETEEGSAPEIAKFNRSEIISVPVFTGAGQKRTFAYIYNTDTATFDLYYTSSGKTYKLVASDCNVAGEYNIFDSIFGGSSTQTPTDDPVEEDDKDTSEE